MVSDRVSQILMFAWMFIVVYVITAHLFLAAFLSVVIMLSRLFGQKYRTEGERHSAEKRYKQSKWLPVFSVVLLLVLGMFTTISVWRMVVVGGLFLVLTVFELVDSYLWYKKETANA
ncbi:hypothetical protein [Alkalicoccobacillus porphyridii]|uniref:Uncharacterized protein n=1 Tax=Alkalicoccobacillus porphyridii TaxID=2597270 RepID=A0A553ZTG3_9BACI|nr:hypothetical protein [Alkalicoccobacillus porphyridii]TSB44764.1 hypothetical protein FN960_19840 [Alkalicoccobacillus porphyridii]